MTQSVTAVIPTIGRPSLTRAVQSVLDQTYPVDEIIVVADADVQVSVPADDRIVLLRNGVSVGPARCRQLGIDAASGSVIALLDDDDVWSPSKLARQLAAVDAVDSDHWIVVVADVGAGTGQPSTEVAAAAYRTRRVGGGVSVSLQRTRVR